MRGLSAIALAPCASLSASGNGAAVDVRNFSGWCKLVLDASATSAAGVTLDVKVQHSADGATGWEDSGVVFDQVDDAEASHQVLPLNIDRFHGFVRIVDTVAGATPSVARAVLLFAKADR